MFGHRWIILKDKDARIRQFVIIDAGEIHIGPPHPIPGTARAGPAPRSESALTTTAGIRIVLNRGHAARDTHVT